MPPLSEDELMAMYAATLFPEMLGTADDIGRTTQTQLLNPDLIASLGLFGPEQITSGLQERLSSAERKAMEEWVEEGFTLEQKIVAERASQQPPVFINEIKNRYQSAPAIWDIVGSLFNNIEEGNMGADAVLDAFSESKSVEYWTTPQEQGGPGLQPEVAAVIGKDNFSMEDLLLNAGVIPEDITRLRNDISDFEDDASAFRSQKLKWEYGADDSKLTELLAEKAVWKQGPKGIDVAEERLDYFKDIGVPGLALLPDPSELPQVSISDVRKPRQAGTDRTLAESQLLANLAPASGRRDLQMQALRDMVGGPGPLPAAISSRVAVPRPSGPKMVPAAPEQLGGRGSGRTTAASCARATAMPQVPLQDTPLRPAGGYRAPSEERDLAKYLEWEQQFYEGERQREARRRASRGDTPFMNTLRALQAYGVEVG